MAKQRKDNGSFDEKEPKLLRNVLTEKDIKEGHFYSIPNDIWGFINRTLDRTPAILLLYYIGSGDGWKLSTDTVCRENCIKDSNLYTYNNILLKAGYIEYLENDSILKIRYDIIRKDIADGITYSQLRALDRTKEDDSTVSIEPFLMDRNGKDDSTVSIHQKDSSNEKNDSSIEKKKASIEKKNPSNGYGYNIQDTQDKEDKEDIETATAGAVASEAGASGLPKHTLRDCTEYIENYYAKKHEPVPENEIYRHVAFYKDKHSYDEIYNNLVKTLK